MGKQEKAKIIKRKEQLEVENKQLRMENIRLKTLIQSQKTSVLGLEPTNSNLSNSTTLGQEVIDVFLEGPRAQLEEERRKLRKKEMEQAKAWEEIHSYRDRLERAKKKMEY